MEGFQDKHTRLFFLKEICQDASFHVLPLKYTVNMEGEIVALHVLISFKKNVPDSRHAEVSDTV